MYKMSLPPIEPTTTFPTSKYLVDEYDSTSGMYTLIEFTQDVWKQVIVMCFCEENLDVGTILEGYLRLVPDKHLLGDWDFPELVVSEIKENE